MVEMTDSTATPNLGVGSSHSDASQDTQIRQRKNVSESRTSDTNTINSNTVNNTVTKRSSPSDSDSARGQSNSRITNNGAQPQSQGNYKPNRTTEDFQDQGQRRAQELVNYCNNSSSGSDWNRGRQSESPKMSTTSGRKHKESSSRASNPSPSKVQNTNSIQKIREPFKQYNYTNKIWFNFDGSGIALICATWSMLAFAAFAANYYIIFFWFEGANDLHLLSGVPLTNTGLCAFTIYWTFFISAISSHVQCIFTHPGVVPHDWQPPPDRVTNTRSCKVCHAFKPDRAHHCRVCNMCIFRMDHHCPWINNCVGFNNQRLFMLFLVYIALLSIYSLLLLIYVLFKYFTSTPDSVSSDQYSNISLICGLILAGESLFFLFFVADFLFEQIESIETNSTLVETYQQKRGRKIGLMPQIYEIFGSKAWLWIVPFANSTEPDYNEPVFDDKGTNGDDEEEVLDNDEIGIVGTDSSDNNDSDRTDEEEYSGPEDHPEQNHNDQRDRHHDSDQSREPGPRHRNLDQRAAPEAREMQNM